MLAVGSLELTEICFREEILLPVGTETCLFLVRLCGITYLAMLSESVSESDVSSDFDDGAGICFLVAPFSDVYFLCSTTKTHLPQK